jgi:hypothetical protein
MPWYARVKMVAAIARNFFKSSDRGSNPAALTHALAFWAKRMSAGKGFMVAVAVAVVVMMFEPSETCFVFDVAQAASLTARCPGLSGSVHADCVLVDTSTVHRTTSGLVVVVVVVVNGPRALSKSWKIEPF